MTKKKYNYFKNEEGRYECGYCGADYKQARGARKHVSKKHKQERIEASQSQKFEKEEKGNEMTVLARGKRIKTLEQLKKTGNVKDEIWTAQSLKLNSWENASKTGDGDIIVTPLFQVKARFVKKEVEPQEFPFISPIRFKLGRLPKKEKKDNGIQTSLFVSDSQIGFEKDMETGKLIPFQNRKSLDIAVQITQEEKPDTIILGGDMIDLAEWSLNYQRTPEMYFTTQAALIELRWWISQLRKASPGAKIVYIEGNHEKRIEKAVLENMKAAARLKPADKIKEPPLLSLENLLGLDSLDVEYIPEYPDSEYWQNDTLVFRHAPSSTSSVPGKSAGNTVKDTKVDVIFGHTHRLEMACKTIYTRKGYYPCQAISMGSTCKIGGNVPGTKKKQNWQNAIGIVKSKDGFNQSYPILIRDDKAIWNDKVFKGRDRLEDLIDDTGWEQLEIDKNKID